MAPAFTLMVLYVSVVVVTVGVWSAGPDHGIVALAYIEAPLFAFYMLRLRWAAIHAAFVLLSFGLWEAYLAADKTMQEEVFHQMKTFIRRTVAYNEEHDEWIQVLFFWDDGNDLEIEAELIQRELRREMEAAILRRIEYALRTPGKRVRAALLMALKSAGGGGR